MTIERITRDFGARPIQDIKEYFKAIDAYIEKQCGVIINEGAREMRENERPFIDINEFLDQASLLKQAMRLLKEYYFEYAAAKNGLISVQELEPTFERIITEMQPITEKEGDIIEGMFDSFLGALTMGGDSDFAFHLIQSQFNLFGDVDDEEEPSFNYATVNIREEIDGILWFRHSFDIEYDDEKEIFKVAENWIHENLMKAVWNNCHLEIVDHT